jgi:hypothetical protein
MRFQDTIEKLKRYPVPSIGGAILLACLVALYFRSGVLSELETRLDDVSRQAIQIDTNLVTGATLVENLEQMRGLVTSLEERIIRQLELPTNKKYFYQLEAETGATLADLQQNPSTPPGKGSTRAFVPVPYAITLSGTFPQMIAYFDELEKGRHFCRVRNFNVQRGRDASQSAVTLAINLELLGWP